MDIRDLIRQAEEVRPGDHLVALYRDEKEIEDYITSYIYAALKQNIRCIYITGDADTTAVVEQVRALSTELADTGDLLVLDKADTYSKAGKFDPDKLISMIKTMVESAISDGYIGLAITGEISWVLDYEDGEDLIIEYEWKLNEYIFDSYPVTALCRYNINRFSHEMIRNIIQLHPIILWQNNIHENPYYIPPEGFKNNEIARYQVDIWLQNINSFSDERKRFKTIVEKKQEEMRLLHKQMTSGLVMAFLKLLETHDSYTKGHCSNVSGLAYHLANKLNISEEFITKIYYAGLVHDIGKTIIPQEVLNKPGRLNEKEYDYIKMHPVYGANALAELEQMDDITIAVRNHHERYDGNGYPDGLAGEKIPLMARIIMICDSYDAMTNDRPYRPALTHEYALQELQACAGTQFDPELVKLFVELFPTQEDVNLLSVTDI